MWKSAFRFLRRERDSNPRRCYPQRFSRPPQSTTLPSLLLIDTLLCFSKAMQRYELLLNCQNIFPVFFEIFFRLRMKGVVDVVLQVLYECLWWHLLAV